jgi:hypothetical protein
VAIAEAAKSRRQSLIRCTVARKSLSHVLASIDQAGPEEATVVVRTMNWLA